MLYLIKIIEHINYTNEQIYIIFFIYKKVFMEQKIEKLFQEKLYRPIDKYNLQYCQNKNLNLL